MAMLDAGIEHTLIVAEDGDILLQKLDKILQPLLIVLDMNMPRVSGIECLRILRSNKAYDKVPIIILSTGAYQRDIEYCISNGANKFFRKPSSISELSMIIKNICTEYIN